MKLDKVNYGGEPLNVDMDEVFLKFTVMSLTRYIITKNPILSMATPSTGAIRAELYLGISGVMGDFHDLLLNLKGIDDDSIISVVRMIKYLKYTVTYENLNYDFTDPDKELIQNIRTMVERSLKFIESENIKIKDHGIDIEEDDIVNSSAFSSDIYISDGKLVWMSKKLHEPCSEDIIELYDFYKHGVMSDEQELFAPVEWLVLYSSVWDCCVRVRV